MKDKDDAFSIIRLEQVPTEKGTPLPDEIKGDYLNWISEVRCCIC
jgi:hypothetical protein